MKDKIYHSKLLPYTIAVISFSLILTGAILASWLGLALLLIGVILWTVLLGRRPPIV